MEGIKAGMEVYRNYDHRFTQAVERSRIRRAIDTQCFVTLSEEGIVARYRDKEANEVEVRRELKLERAKSADKMRSVAEEQMAKSGDTIFRVQSVEVVGAEWFATAKLLAEVRREALSLLAAMRYERNKPTPRILEDDGTAQYPIKRL